MKINLRVALPAIVMFVGTLAVYGYYRARDIDRASGSSAAERLEHGPSTVTPSLSFRRQFIQQRPEVPPLLPRECPQQVAFGLLLDARSFSARFAAGGGQGGQSRPPIERIGLPPHVAVRLEPIDELRDVRFHAGEPLGEVTQWY